MITVRPAEKRDAEQIAVAEKLYIDCPWTQAQIESELDDPSALFFTAECDGKFAGYLSGEVVCDECEISNIAVMEEFRRRGAGAMLFNALFAKLDAMNVKQTFLLVREDNVAAKSLYLKLGFVVAGRRKNYYRGKDALIMRK